jgi:hypothetical protein
MVPRFFFAAFSIAFAVAVVFPVVTTVKHVEGTRAGVSAIRVG